MAESPPVAGGVEPIATFENVTKRYHGRNGDFNAVDDFSLVITPGSRTAIIGESGSGKSTTAKMLLGLTPRSSGSLTVLGKDWDRLKGRRRAALRSRIGSVFQEPIESLDPMMHVGAIVVEPLLVHQRHLGKAEMRTRVRDALDRVGLPAAMLDRRPAQLSGGQAQRVSIARALITRPELLVLDEPTSALDVSVQAQILDLLEEIGEQDQLTWVFITHDLGVARGVCQDIVVMQRGRTVEYGPAAAVLEAPAEQYTRELVASSLLG